MNPQKKVLTSRNLCGNVLLTSQLGGEAYPGKGSTVSHPRDRLTV